MRTAPAQTLRLRLIGIRYAAHGIHLLEFGRPDGAAPLPAFTPGAHVDLHLANGLVRPYSLVNPPEDSERYVVAVKRDPASRGGSAFVHEVLRVGAELEVGVPRNNFELHAGSAQAVFIAGGIGITPIACMVDRLRRDGRSWELHYSVRERREAAFVEELGDDRVHLHVDAESAGALLDIAAIVAAAPADAHLYCCGPAPMLDAFEAAAGGRPPACVHVERFAPVAPGATGGGYTVRLAASKRSIPVAPGRTILEALREAGVEVQASCEQGICGTCETRVLGGLPDHRDSLLSAEERKSNRVMMICCSGSLGGELVLDL
ncbi:PDR/VanB family oxidoreductase [Variovorax sp. PBL-E5]|uniref:PDR/VanB family oxidoreductase n=1 Tax=Variovorax sp. PBL-E5 TaxID=434014 RepID=UPI001317948F|nr:PDR/VanB family oxidoreductase [Variovorax sp. PBL-E5]VTU26033.1 Phenoxybenzoate dioxygenase subunit beta [Variovorax sp. PBL-E5]